MNIQTKTIALSHDCVALATLAPDGKTIRHVHLLCTGGADEGAYFPPQEVCLYGLAAVTKLRDFCEELIKEETK